MLRVATILSAREWESRLVAAARDTAMIRLVLRAFLPDEVGTRAAGIDVVVAGSETPWVTPTRVAAWKRLGLRVVGIHPTSDRPGAERLRAGGADLVLPDDLDAEALVREIRVLDMDAADEPAATGRFTVVTGVHGAPGVSEIAIALAWNEAGRSDCVLLDGDLVAPSLAVRLGLPPRPDLADVVDRSIAEPTPVLDGVPAIGSLQVIPGVMRSGAIGLRTDVVLDVAEGLASGCSVVMDCGRWPTAAPLVRSADRAVLVTGTTPVSIVRLARLVEEWVGPQPALVVNGVDSRRRLEVLGAIRRWSGLEPAVVIPHRRRLATAAAAGREPAPSLRRRLAPLGATA
jgi:hypothetical protein